MTPDVAAEFHVVDRASAPLAEIVERLRRDFGLHVTSTPKPHEEPMPTQNPYDRRADQRSGARRLYSDDDMFAGTPMQAQAGGVSSGLAIEDLHAIAYSARVRGAEHIEKQLTREHHEQMATAQRMAWDEGHAAGMSRGRALLLAQIDTAAGDVARGGHRNAAEVLQRVGLDPGKVTKAELEKALDAAVDTLARLMDAHHHGFEGRV